MSKKILFIVITLFVFSLTALPVWADGPSCDDDYSVQANDWLSKIADHYFGDMMEYPGIVAATNLAADQDASYAHIEDADKIEVGDKLCIPKTDNAQSIAAQIENAESSGPPDIAKNATIYGTVDGNWVMLRQGSNNWECDPDWADSPMNDPICVDELGKRWNDAAFGYDGGDGSFSVPTPAFSYMLQGGGDAVDWNADPLVWETYPPHAIVIFPNLSDTDGYTTDPFNGGPWIMGDGSPYEHIMIPTVREQIPFTTDKIANALSALPAELADHATVMDLALDDNGQFVVLREGDNGWYCWPDWDASPTNDPMCGDEVWLEWNLAFSNGLVPNITKPGIAYMLQGGGDASNTDPYAAGPPDGEGWVISPPHVMILYPGGFDSTYISTDPDNGGPYIMWDGTPYEHVMYPVNTEPSVKDHIKNAESAAPNKIATGSTVYDMVAGNWMVVKQGTNQWECDPDWDLSPMNDPICVDELAKRWNDAAFGYDGGDGSFSIPTPAFSYMLQGGGDAVDWNADPLVWETYPPHAIVIFPNLSDTDGYTTDPFNGGPWIMGDGSPYEHIMIPTVREEIPFTPDKVANALSALPAELADHATVMDLALDDNGQFVVLREGDNGWYCWPDWDVSPVNDPMCGDEVWLEWNLAFSNGLEPNITKPGIAYMLQGGGDASNTDPYASAPPDGADWVISPPHVMILYPGGFDSTYISTDPKNGGPYIMWGGTPYEHVMYPAQLGN